MSYTKINIRLSQISIKCECKPDCMERATQHHHKYEQGNRKFYGKLIDDDVNIQLVSHKHHVNCKHISEQEFCNLLNIEPRSKVLKGKILYKGNNI